MTNSEFESWRKQGLELRRKLETQEREVAAHLAEIRRELAQLPTEEAPRTTRRLAVAGRRSKELTPTAESTVATLPERVVELLDVENRPRSATDILTALRKTDDSVEPASLHSAIYRLQKQGLLAANGKRGRRTYALTREMGAA